MHTTFDIFRQHHLVIRSKHHYHACIQIYIEELWLTADSHTSDRFRSESRFNSPFNYLCVMTRYTLDSPLWVNLHQVFFSVHMWSYKYKIYMGSPCKPYGDPSLRTHIDLQTVYTLNRYNFPIFIYYKETMKTLVYIAHTN